MFLARQHVNETALRSRVLLAEVLGTAKRTVTCVCSRLGGWEAVASEDRSCCY